MSVCSNGDSDDPVVVVAPAPTVPIAPEAVVERRVSRLEFNDERNQDRLSQVIDSLKGLSKSFAELEAKFSPKWTTVAAIFVVVAGWVWIAARYPDPDKFEKLRDHVQTLQVKQTEIQADTANVVRTINGIDVRQARMESKIDNLINVRSMSLTLPLVP